VSERSRAGRGRRAPAEWWSFGIALAILVVVVVGLAVQIGGEAPAHPVVAIGIAVERPDGTFEVPVEVRNDGDRAAAEVQVSAQLVTPDGEQTGDQIIDFLGAGEVQSLVFVFTTDPQAGTFSLGVTSFARP